MDSTQHKNQKWYNKRFILVLLFFILPPLGIYAVWKSNIRKDWKKAVYTIFATMLTIILIPILLPQNSYSSSQKYKIDEKKDIEHYKKVEDERRILEEQYNEEKELNEKQLVKLTEFQKKWADSIFKDESQVGNRHFVDYKLNLPYSITFEYTESITKKGFYENLKVDTIAYNELYQTTLREKFGEEFSNYNTKIDFIPNSKVDFKSVEADNNRKNERNNKIAMQFSQWDGSHTNLERMVKNSMNDPSSFDHVKTTYQDNGNYILVQMSFRGKNAFGAKVLNSVTAKVDENGNILSISNN